MSNKNNNTNSAERICYTINEVATMLGVTRQSINLMMRRGDLPYIKLGKNRCANVRIMKEDFDKFINRYKGEN